MRLIIKQTKQQAGIFAAHEIASQIRAFRPTSNKPFVLGLPTGSTPLITYAELIKMYQNGTLSFKNVITFNMDEYLGISPQDEQSYHFFMHHYFFKHIDIQKQNIHILNGMATNPEKECENYEKAIQNAGGIHLFLGGVGEDGHISFNEPHTPFLSRTHVQQLDKDTIRVNARFFNNDISKVPTKALTVGIQTITDADQVIILAFGPKKAEAVRAALEDDISENCPLSVLRMHRNATLICDADATKKLSSQTKALFSKIENS